MLLATSLLGPSGGEAELSEASKALLFEALASAKIFEAKALPQEQLMASGRAVKSRVRLVVVFKLLLKK